MKVHPRDALFAGEKPFPAIPCCEHFAGKEKLIRKALTLQAEMGPIFDITCDCEDGAAAGQEREHAEMVAAILASDANVHHRAGVRIHDYTHAHWQTDLEIILPAIGDRIAYITIPKATAWRQVAEMIDTINDIAKTQGLQRAIPVHVLIETHGALRDVWKIASLPNVEVLDFGMMDFVSGHHGALPAATMRSPGQFEHPLLVRAKTEMVAAALANGVVPAHNVTLDLKSPYQTYQDAYRARYEFGFLRMWSIHPVQIKAIVDAMQPDYSEVEDAANILISAQDNHWGPIQYKGELHDRATYRYFWELLERAKNTGVPIPEEAQQRFFGG